MKKRELDTLKIKLKRLFSIFWIVFYYDHKINNTTDKEIHQILGNDYKPYKEKSKDDGLSL